MIRRHLLALAFACLAASSAWADDPAPPPTPKAVAKVKPSYRPGSLVVVDATASTGDSFTWVCYAGLDFLKVNGDKQVVFATGDPGSYKFLLIAAGVVNGKGAVDTAEVTVVIDGPPPPAPRPDPPGPGPTPDPTPPPPVATGTLNVSLIVDMNTIDPPLAIVKLGAAIRPAFGQFDAVYRTYSSAAPDIAALNLTSFVTAKGLPTLIVQDAGGKIIIAEKAPLTEAEVIARVKGLRGGR